MEKKDEKLPEWCKTGKQILDLGFTTQPVLLDPIIPKGVISALVGSSDTGKSMLLLQLAKAIVTGNPECFGLKLNTKYKKVIILATEDSNTSLSTRLNKFFKTDEEKKCLDSILVFHRSDKVIDKLKELLENHEVDAILLDTFADFFEGCDMNQATEIRKFLEPYKQLAAVRNISIVFVHHLAKRTGNFTPSKDSILGSQGFESSMRSVLLLQPDWQRPDISHLCVVKSNYLDRFEKQNAYELRFDNNVGFVPTGNRVPLDRLGRFKKDSATDNIKKERARKLVEQGSTCEQASKILTSEGFKGCSKSAVSNWTKGVEREKPDDKQLFTTEPTDAGRFKPRKKRTGRTV